jgi:acyl dehydratase
MSLLFLEDLANGQRFSAGPITIDADSLRAFAAAFDPQPFHLDEVAARSSLFNGLVASGWHTAALTMRMLVEALPFAGGTIGTRAELRWPAPVHPGDRLSMEAEVSDARPSARRPGFGVVRLLVQTRNQDNVLVMEMTTLVLVHRRTAGGNTAERPTASDVIANTLNTISTSLK